MKELAVKEEMKELAALKDETQQDSFFH